MYNFFISLAMSWYSLNYFFILSMYLLFNSIVHRPLRKQWLPSDRFFFFVQIAQISNTVLISDLRFRNFPVLIISLRYQSNLFDCVAFSFYFSIFSSSYYHSGSFVVVATIAIYLSTNVFYQSIKPSQMKLIELLA